MKGRRLISIYLPRLIRLCIYTRACIKIKDIEIEWRRIRAQGPYCRIRDRVRFRIEMYFNLYLMEVMPLVYTFFCQSFDK